MTRFVRFLVFTALRLYVWTERTRLGGWLLITAIPWIRYSVIVIKTLRAVVVAYRWFAGKQPDIILEPLAREGDGVPEVHEQRSVFVSGDARSAYTHEGSTLRRVGQNDAGELVYLRKANKREQRAMKRAKKRAHDRIAAGA